MKNMNEPQKIEDSQMEEVVGGRGDYFKPENSNVRRLLADMFPKIKIKCADCGKEIEVIDKNKSGWAGIDTARDVYYDERCRDCAKKKPYFGDVYDSEKDIFVRDIGAYLAKLKDKNLKSKDK